MQTETQEDGQQDYREGETRRSIFEHLLYTRPWARSLRYIKAFNPHKSNFRNEETKPRKGKATCSSLDC